VAAISRSHTAKPDTGLPLKSGKALPTTSARFANWLQLIAEIGYVSAGILLVLIMSAVSSRQQARAERLMLT
jgi:hypothetical protein